MKRILSLLLLLPPLLAWGQDTLVHDVATGPLTIPAGSNTVYVLTGSTSDTNHNVVISPGFNGTVILRNLEMTFTDYTRYWQTPSPIRLQGVPGSYSDNPLTTVDFILDGDNRILVTNGYNCCIQVDIGTTARFSAINPLNHLSGTLCAIVHGGGDEHDIGNCGAAIGQPGPNHIGLYTDTARIPASPPKGDGFLAGRDYFYGGNIVITSGLIQAQGWESAGIGGSATGSIFSFNYDGAIIISGGIVNASGNPWYCGIGNRRVRGRPDSVGSPNHAIIILPPAQVSATGTSARIYSPTVPMPLGSTPFLLNFGIRSAPAITLSTQDLTPGADFYADLSAVPRLSDFCSRLLPRYSYNLSHHYLGTAGDDGRLTLHGQLPQALAFSTDAHCQLPGYEGLPYASSTDSAGAISLPRIYARLSLRAHQPEPLVEGYPQAEAQAKAFVLRLDYSDPDPLTQFSASLADGSAFLPVEILAADSLSPFLSSTLTQGTTLFLRCPLRTSLPDSLYSDRLLLSGLHGGAPIGTLSQPLSQRVLPCDTVILCQDDSYTLPWGTTVSESGTYLHTDTTYRFQALDTVYHYSCNDTLYSLVIQPDTLLTLTPRALHLLFRPTLTGLDSASACDSLLWNGLWLTTEGDHPFPTVSAQGCDSVATLRLSLRHSLATHDSLTLCASALPQPYRDTLFLPGTESGPYTFLRTSLEGCDSTHLLLLSIRPNDTTLRFLDLADTAFPLEFLDTLFLPGTESGLYTFLSQNRFGCDSLTLLYLTLLPTPPPPDTLPALWVPNACIPGLPFQAKGWGIGSFEIDIFDRLGRPVWHSEDIDTPWDGGSLPQGTYVYLIRYTLSIRPNEPLTRKGTITLLR